MNMPTRSLALAAVACLSFDAATTAFAQTVINSVPYTITTSGKYILGNNFITSSVNQNAVVVNAPNVILDLNGFFVSGPGGGTTSTNPVIAVLNVSNVTIRNGTITNNGFGIVFYGGANASNYLVENVNVTKCFVTGIDFETAAPGSLVRNNAISRIGGYTGSTNAPTEGIATAGGVSVENNLIATVTGTGTSSGCGITAGSTDFAVGNKISTCTVGIQMSTGGKFLNNLTSNGTTTFSGGTNAAGNY